MRIKCVLLLIIFGAIAPSNFGQSGSRTSSPVLRMMEVGDLLEPVTNCAVSHYSKNDTDYIYVFGGLDSTLKWSGIHRRSYKVNLTTMEITRIPDIPDTRGKLAASASRIGDRIYIIGGYYVNSNGSETTSDLVHIFNPIADTFEVNGANVPIPIDDHIQRTNWDSLIYCFTGWSNGKNIRNVQVYDPTNNLWFEATPLPISDGYKSFGGSGTIYNNTISIFGGAYDKNGFPGNPTGIVGEVSYAKTDSINWKKSWSLNKAYGDSIYYRSLMTSYGRYVVGGSNDTYNYDGRSYATNQILQPRSDYLNASSNIPINTWNWKDSTLRKVPMDLRDWCTMKNSRWGNLDYSVGGIESNQVVGTRIIKYYTNWISDIEENIPSIHFSVFPNPVKNKLNVHIDEKNGTNRMVLLNLFGERLSNFSFNSGIHELDFSEYKCGIYFLQNVESGESIKLIKK